MNEKTDVIIVGTGVAGLFCALSLPDDTKIIMLTKKKAEESDSFLAQGGICVLKGEEDFKDYFEDTLKAGHYQNNKKALELMIRSSNAVIRRLISFGVNFQKEEDGSFAYTKEGAHSSERILYYADITGKEMTFTLLNAVKEKKNITIVENSTMVDLIIEKEHCRGVIAVDEGEEKTAYFAEYTVLATGGIGGLYPHSTNYSHISGDALALALKYGIDVENLDYVQIHPTTLYTKKLGRSFLISESVRGEGAKLYDKEGRRFTNELLPRDVLTQNIFEQMEKDGTDFVWEDMRPIGEKNILKHFPNIYRRCLEEGYNVLKEPIPVVPAQHYHMGGIKTDLGGRTSLVGLYVVGEAACTGVHGKNRLASNSLLEALVFAERAANDICFGKKKEEVSVSGIDFSEYEDTKAIFEEYRIMILTEIERMKKEHE